MGTAMSLRIRDRKQRARDDQERQGDPGMEGTPHPPSTKHDARPSPNGGIRPSRPSRKSMAKEGLVRMATQPHIEDGEKERNDHSANSTDEAGSEERGDDDPERPTRGTPGTSGWVGQEGPSRHRQRQCAWRRAGDVESMNQNGEAREDPTRWGEKATSPRTTRRGGTPNWETRSFPTRYREGMRKPCRNGRTTTNDPWEDIGPGTSP